MRTYLQPGGSPLTDQQFVDNAVNNPAPFAETFMGSLKEGFKSTFGAGTLYREAITPDIPRKPVIVMSGQNTPGGRGGMQQYRMVRQAPLDAAEVAATGDKQYGTQEQYKASPYYRANIPWEPGMTESRARSLAEQQDLANLREHYGSKRPVTAFIGQLAGAALDPVNYIPIVGEVGYAATSARVGKIAGRALLSGADAAANAALFGALTAPERARLGDDVSWQAMSENVAFAAMAGFTFGAIGGTVSKLRGEKVAVPDVARETAPAIEGMAKPQEAFWSTSDTIHSPSPVETPAMRAKATMVLNDAMISLANDGEVRISPEAMQHFEAMRRGAEAANLTEFAPARPETFSAPAVDLPFARYKETAARIDSELVAPATQDAEVQRMIESAKAEGLFVQPEPKPEAANANDPLQQPGEWRNAKVKATGPDGNEYEVNAGQVVDSLNQRIKAVQSLMECLGAAAA